MSPRKLGSLLIAARPWLLVALLWIVALLNYVDRQVVFSFFPLLREDLHVSDVELGLISTVFLWVYGLLSPFAGYLADRFGRVRVILFSLLVWSAVTLITGQVRDVGEMLWARALMGVSEACYLPAALALIVDWHPERSRSLATGLHQSGLYTGMIMGGAWGGWMGEHYGWRAVFAILGGVGVGYFVLLWLGLRQFEKRMTVQTRPVFLLSFRRLLTTPGFIVLTAVFAAMAIANWLVYTWLPLYLYESFRFSLAKAGFSATFYIQAASYAGILIGGYIADRWNRSNTRGRLLTQVLGLAFGAPFLFLLGVTHSYVLLVLALITFGLGRGFYDCNAMPVLSQLVPPDLRSTGYGVFNLAGCLAGGITAVFAGYLKAVIGLGAAFQISAFLILFSSLLLLRLRITGTGGCRGMGPSAKAQCAPYGSGGPTATLRKTLPE